MGLSVELVSEWTVLGKVGTVMQTIGYVVIEHISGGAVVLERKNK